MTDNRRILLGATVADDGGVYFRLWSDKANRAAVVLYDDDGWEIWEEPLSVDPEQPHYFGAYLDRASVGSLYRFKLDGKVVGDPYARCFPFGPRGPARVIAPLKPRLHPKRAIDLTRGEVIYELHVGTFTAEGTFTGVRERLPHLQDLGVTVLELLPIAAFPGERGWGYDGVGLFAPFIGYGTSAELSELIDAAHAHGMSVMLDVVYNHLGPECNVLPSYSDLYFHPERKNPWGCAPAFEGVPFRRLVVDSARHWLEEVGFDGLRIDAAHELEPGGEPHILLEVARIAAACSPAAVLVAEDDRNDPEQLATHGVSAVWSDDFHHSLHVLLTGEKDGYYEGYEGTLAELATIINRNQLYEGQIFPPSKRARGKPAAGVDRHRFVYSLQNHDQVGNRALGERISALTDPARLRAATLLLLFLPATPMLFMGQEWGSRSPFLYFADHAEPLASEITKGRRAEFAHFAAFAKDPDAVPDPQKPETFAKSRLSWEEVQEPEAAALLAFHRAALKLRRDDPVLKNSNVSAHVRGDVLWVERRSEQGVRVLLLNLENAVVPLGRLELPRDARVLLSSEEAPQSGADGTLAALSAAIFAFA